MGCCSLRGWGLTCRQPPLPEARLDGETSPIPRLPKSFLPRGCPLPLMLSAGFLQRKGQSAQCLTRESKQGRQVKALSRVRLFANPRTVAHQAPLSVGISRQEYRSGLPLPSPGDLPDPGMEPRSPALQADSLPSEPPGKPKNTGVGSLSLLQGIFPTQGLNLGFAHCRRTLYHLSHQ